MVLKPPRSRPPSKHDIETVFWTDGHGAVWLRQVHHGRHVSRRSRESFASTRIACRRLFGGRVTWGDWYRVRERMDARRHY